MKVICINNKEVEALLAEGKVYTVAFNEPPFYHLTELLINPFTGMPAGFYHDRFIPLSDIDETEIAKEREHQFITNETTT